MATNIQPRFRFFPNRFKKQKINFLDIGAGSNSASITMRIFPNANYYGVDITTDYGNSEKDFKLMKKFYQKDLTKLQFDDIPDNFFDVIMMSHIIEHLHNGDVVTERLISKLKTNGFIYIEYPGKRSTKLPSMKGTLNFYDDKTHVRIYSVEEISSILKNNGCEILKSGTRRHWPFVLFMPLNIIKQFIKHKFVPAGVFWDITGFAEFVYAIKKY